MADNILERDIQVGVEEAWHRKTVVVNEITNKNCGILYDMELQQLQTIKGRPTDHYITVSLDDNLPIGAPVSPKYALISNRQIWDALQSSISHKECDIVSCGTVNNRELGFISVKFSSEFIAAGRATLPTMNILFGHGGNFKVHAKTGFTVVVCQNTFQMAMEESGDFSFQTKHIGDVEFKLNNMEEAIHAHFRTINEFTEAMEKMANMPISERNAHAFFAGFSYPKGDVESKPPSTQALNQLQTLKALFHDGAGNSGENRADVFNAMTDYFSHGDPLSKKSAWRTYVSSEFGSNALRKQEGFKLLLGQEVSRLGKFEDVVERGEEILEWVR